MWAEGQVGGYAHFVAGEISLIVRISPGDGQDTWISSRETNIDRTWNNCQVSHQWNSTTEIIIRSVNIERERANMHCQDIPCTVSFYMGLTSAEGQKLKCLI